MVQPLMKHYSGLTTLYQFNIQNDFLNENPTNSMYEGRDGGLK